MTSKIAKRGAAAAIAADRKRKKISKKKPKYQITKSEVKRRIGYLALGIFAANLIDPVQNFIHSMGINPIWVSVAGIIAVLYFFDF